MQSLPLKSETAKVITAEVRDVKECLLCSEATDPNRPLGDHLELYEKRCLHLFYIR